VGGHRRIPDGAIGDDGRRRERQERGPYEGQDRFGALLRSYAEGGKGPSGASECSEEFRTRWEVLSQEEVERREIERERASRYVTSCLFFFLSLSTSCGSWLILRFVVSLDDCGEKRRNCRVRPGRRGYDTRVFPPSHIFFIIFLGLPV
jgi:hypothetical protein